MNWDDVAHDYQFDTVAWMLDRPGGAVFADPGLGKTSMALALIRVLSEKFQQRALVLAPKHVALNVWGAEVQKWSEFRDLRVSLVHGAKKEQALRADADIYVTTYDTFHWIAKQPRWKWPEILILDESTKIKSPSSKRWKALKPNLNKFKRVYCLTGTPMPNSLEDLFTQVYAIDSGRALGERITHFRLKYFRPGGYKGYQWIPHDDAEERIFEKIGHLAQRLDEDDLLDLPRLHTVEVTVPLPDRARRVYRGLEMDLIAELKSGAIVARNAAAKTMKLRQIANGFAYTEDDFGERTGALELHEAKLDALEAILDERSRPTLIVYEFKHDLEMLHRRFGEFAFIGGGTSAKAAARAIAAWNAGDLPLMGLHPASAGHGLNLQEGLGNAIVFYALGYNYDNDYQVIKRIYRQGQKSRVTVFRLLAERTLDPLILQVLQRKGAGQRALFDAIKTHYQEN